MLTIFTFYHAFLKLSHNFNILHTPTPPAVSLNVYLNLVADPGGESKSLYSLNMIVSLRVPESTCLPTFLFLATFLSFNTVWLLPERAHETI